MGIRSIALTAMSVWLPACAGDAGAPRELPVRVVGSARLEEVGTIDLLVTGGPAIGNVAVVRVGDSSILVVDGDVTKGIYEYERSGRYRRRIGQRGRGEAEYIMPMSRAVGVTAEAARPPSDDPGPCRRP